MVDSSPHGRARWAVDHAQDVPAEAARVAAELLTALPAAEREARALAGWAAGLAARELGDLPGSRRWLEAAITEAASAGQPALAAEIRSSLSLVLAYIGDVAAALRQADRAARHLAGSARARNEMQRALILQRLGRYGAALAGYDRALAELRDLGDELGTARLLLNRGVLHGYRFRFAEAVADLEEAAGIAARLDQSLLLASVVHNLGFLEGRRGDIPAALTRFDEAAALYEAAGSPAGHLVMLVGDRIEVLRAAGLVDAARRAVGDLVAGVDASPNSFDRAEVLLVAARCALDANDLAAAAAFAGEAERDFTARRRSVWADVSRLVGLRAVAATAEDPGELSRRAARLGGRLARVGLAPEAAEARMWAGRLAAEAGERSRARAAYRRVAAIAPVTSVETALVAEARARAALLDGDLAGAEQAARRGIDAVARGIMALGGTEMRARAADQGLELTAIALGAALARGDALGALAALDARRSLTARLPPARPPGGDRSGDLFGQLRDVVARLETPDETPEERAALTVRLGRLEADIADRERRRPGLPVGPVSEVAVEDLLGRLGARTLVAYFGHRGRVGAIVASAGGARLVDAGPDDRIRTEARSLLFALRRLASGHGSEASLAAARLAAEEAAAALDASLLAEAGNAPELVVVPTGVLHRLPWRALPGLTARPFSVVASLAAWGAAAGRPPVGPAPSWLGVAGPGLPGAAREVDRISGLYPTGTALTGPAATAAAVRDRIGRVDIAHVAAHGTFRTDNPLFSSMRMADGPLTVYELELLESVPSLVVLSACDSGVNDVTRGDALLGLSAALLGLGAGAVVGPVVPVPDEEAAEVMCRFHERLLAAGAPARALAGTAGDDSDDRRWATERAFVVFGASAGEAGISDGRGDSFRQ